MTTAFQSILETFSLTPIAYLFGLLSTAATVRVLFTMKRLDRLFVQLKGVNRKQIGDTPKQKERSLTSLLSYQERRIAV